MPRSNLKIAAALLTVGIVSFAAGAIAQGRYPEINRAEGHLQAALGDLHVARDVFGGHKVNAEGLIQQALGQLQEGKGFAAAHGN
ncbi:MAG: hypothetical protein JO032_00420 [Alphaproteobacteria bacterium]|nr:hypothetical protein [Alphaproteobacteria bacterium]MBV9551228.1 hypothetical protein [Alphaproteobacteria bacterium]